MFQLIRAILAGSEVVDEVGKVKRQLRELRDDLTSLEDRHERLHGRLAKRRDRAAVEEEVPNDVLQRREHLNRMILAKRGGVRVQG